MTYHPQLQTNFLVMLQENLFFSYQLFLRYLHTSQDENVTPDS